MAENNRDGEEVLVVDVVSPPKKARLQFPSPPTPPSPVSRRGPAWRRMQHPRWQRSIVDFFQVSTLPEPAVSATSQHRAHVWTEREKEDLEYLSEWYGVDLARASAVLESCAFDSTQAENVFRKEFGHAPIIQGGGC